MRTASRAVLAALTLIALPLQAEVTTVAVNSVVNAEVASLKAQLDQLEQRLAESERLRSELKNELESSAAIQVNAQISRLNQDNQRLKLQLKATQAQQPGQLFSEQQRWFGIGGGVALLAFLFGALARGASKKRREWLN
jgi:SH3 domain protein